MRATGAETQYPYSSAEASPSTAYLMSPVTTILARHGVLRLLDLGCGNGSFTQGLAALGFDVVGCDPSAEGIRIARKARPELVFERLGVYDDPGALGDALFDAVVSIEVVEHLAEPRRLPRFAKEVLRPGGLLVLSTPFHGYLKNLAISVRGGWDRHWDPGWDGGHLKFWSRRTLSKMLAEEGFEVTEVVGAGRVPFLWKSMIAVSRLR